MNLREVTEALRASWWLLLLGLLVGGAVGFLLSAVQTPLYSSSTQFFVSTRDSTTAADAFQGSQLSQQRVSSYAELVTGEEVASRVIDRLGLAMSTDQLRTRLSATVVPETVLIDVQVADESAERAQQIALAVGRDFKDFIAQLETPDAGGITPIKVDVSKQPALPSGPSSPNTSRTIVLATIVGLAVGALSALVRARLDRSIKSVDEAAKIAAAPVVGVIVRDSSLESRRVIGAYEQTSAAEGYRQLRTNLQFLDVDKPPKVILITSAMPSEGKTTVAVNLAVALSQIGRRCTVVEADFRRPRVTRYLGIVAGAGLSSVLAGAASLEEVRQTHGDRGLLVIAAGPTPPNPGELLASSQMASLVASLRDANDFVLIDSPPLLPVADSSALATIVDGVVLSLRYGVTDREQLAEARAMLDHVGARTLGVVLNFVPAAATVATAYEYGEDGAGPETGVHRLVKTSDEAKQA